MYGVRCLVGASWSSTSLKISRALPEVLCKFLQHPQVHLQHLAAQKTEEEYLLAEPFVHGLNGEAQEFHPQMHAPKRQTQFLAAGAYEDDSSHSEESHLEGPHEGAPPASRG